MSKYENYYIYKIYQLSNPELIYIGSTTNFSQRKSNHKKNCNNKVSKKYHYPLYKYIRACGGWDTFNIEVIEKNPYKSKEDILKREQELIDLLQARINAIKSIKN
jgi:hypothetical protein